jgi:hypothetical protein
VVAIAIVKVDVGILVGDAKSEFRALGDRLRSRLEKRKQRVLPPVRAAPSLVAGARARLAGRTRPREVKRCVHVYF